MKKTQVTENPFVNSDTNKRYYTYDYYLRRTFGGKCMKIPLDAGFTCPNIDGRCSVGGCIYCSSRGSGDFAESAVIPVDVQFDTVKEKLSSKWHTDKYIPYFQAHTNTYAPTEIIRERVESVMKKEGVVGLNIATRADCLEPETLGYLSELAERTTLTVELGLQSVHDETARIINRGHSFEDFLEGYGSLREASDKINVCVHLIHGLPGESTDMMLESAARVAALRPDQVKIHLLHVIRGTPLAQMYLDGKYEPMSMESYVEVTARALCLLHHDTVIGRLTGDGMQSELLAPDWSRRKTEVINNVDKYMYSNGLIQGMHFSGMV